MAKARTAGKAGKQAAGVADVRVKASGLSAATAAQTRRIAARLGLEPTGGKREVFKGRDGVECVGFVRAVGTIGGKGEVVFAKGYSAADIR